LTYALYQGVDLRAQSTARAAARSSGLFLPLDKLKPALSQLATACCELVSRCRNSRRKDAEDVAQDACIHLLRLSAPQTVQQPARYLARVARNLLIDRSRRRKRETVLFDSSADALREGRDGLDPERIASGEQALMRALVAIDDLPPRCREAFELHRFEGLNYIGIARRMGISTSMAEKHIAEATLRLTRALALGCDEAAVLPRRMRERG
jgi:RNA polymerase sigma-70 factor (ECF subfamily)